MKTKIKIILLLAALFIPAVSSAGSLVLTLGSKHIFTEKQKYDYNEINPGVLYYADNGWFGGAYLNSYKKIAPAVGKRWEHGSWFGQELGMAWYPGYKNQNGKAKAPTPRPFWLLTADYKGFRLGYSPMVYKDNRGVFTLSYVVKLD